ncbi:MAG: SCO family protein [Alphaproteobacteria bacterium]
MSPAPRRARLVRLLAAVILGAGAGFGLLALFPEDKGGPAAIVGPVTTRGVALIGGSFSLTDQHGKSRTEREFRGKYMLIFFGYTHCPDVCPTGLQDMSEALDALGPEAGKVQPIFVTIDPKRDTPALLKDYAANFHSKLIALTGTPAAIARAAKAYRVYFARTGDKSGDDYLMNHSTFTYFMGPDGKYLTRFTHNTKPKSMAAGMRKFLGAGGAAR